VCHRGDVPPTADLRPAPARPPRDVAGLLRALENDASPRLTWYGHDGDRIELSGRVLVTWVAKTAHQLAEDADLEPGGLVRVLLGGDWRAPVFWLAASYLGARVEEVPDGEALPAADVVVVPEGTRAAPAPAVTVVVPRSALPGPAADLPSGALDHGEVSQFPDALPAPGPSVALTPGVPDASGSRRRLLRGPGTPPAAMAAIWATGGSVVLHVGLAPDRLARVTEQERVADG
jgi:uncharacterized protein (TIGR03089 family)